MPRLAQTITAAPYVTAGWDALPGATGLTDFSGTPITTLPQAVTYLSKDVIPVLETQRANYEKLVSISPVQFIGPLVLAVGLIVAGYGLIMLLLARAGWPGIQEDGSPTSDTRRRQLAGTPS